MGTTVCDRDLGDGRTIQVTWGGSQTAVPTGALDGAAQRRTRYFFEVLVDGIYYFGNRFLTSADAEQVRDARGTPILARTDLLLQVCCDRVARAVADGQIDSLPNDLGSVEIDELVARAGDA